MKVKHILWVSIIISILGSAILFCSLLSITEEKEEITIIEKFQENGSYIIKTSDSNYKEVDAGYYYNYNIGDQVNSPKLMRAIDYAFSGLISTLVGVLLFFTSLLIIDSITDKMAHSNNNSDIKESG